MIESGIGVVIFIFGAVSAEAVPEPISTTAAMAQSSLVVRIIVHSSSTSGATRQPRVEAFMVWITYCATLIPGGCHVPWPAGRMEGASVFGQYSRITR
jgi:hypothetical protein